MGSLVLFGKNTGLQGSTLSNHHMLMVSVSLSSWNYSNSHPFQQNTRAHEGCNTPLSKLTDHLEWADTDCYHQTNGSSRFKLQQICLMGSITLHCGLQSSRLSPFQCNRLVCKLLRKCHAEICWTNTQWDRNFIVNGLCQSSSGQFLLRYVLVQQTSAHWLPWHCVSQQLLKKMFSLVHRPHPARVSLPV